MADGFDSGPEKNMDLIKPIVIQIGHGGWEKSRKGVIARRVATKQSPGISQVCQGIASLAMTIFYETIIH
jgi:hypothetical protein